MRILKTDHDHREIGLHKIILHEANSYLVISVSLTLLLLKHNIDLFWKTQFYN
ncbi:unnamed protein product [Brassica rapa]|uniref:Uncharacterized protein n=1 Tax=Brassica campestris TaxID=3711 RepID=A0A8D9CR51_BRACM|nr:unnamed protein product [Brassica rapa]